MPNFKRIPFELGSELLVQSLSHLAHKAITKVVGEVRDNFIIVETPVFAISDNISAIVEGMIVCSYLHEGYLFKFRSRFGKELTKNILCIDYPQEFEVEQIRQYPRIGVDLDVQVALGNEKMLGKIRDISEKGCFLELNKMVSAFRGLELSATFTLPNDELVNNLRCKILNVKMLQIRKYTSLGVTSLGPPAEIEKMVELCRLCMRFKVWESV